MSREPSNCASTELFLFEESGSIPNNPDLPVILCRNVLDAGDRLADEFEERFRGNGWTGTWRWGVYRFHHYHSLAHEALGVASGNALLRLGGPEGKEVSVKAGDLVILPAGTGHKNESSSDDFLVVGAYPPGQSDYDLVREGHPLTDQLRNNIAHTPIPEHDPLFGKDGSVTRHWPKRPAKDDA